MGPKRIVIQDGLDTYGFDIEKNGDFEPVIDLCGKLGNKVIEVSMLASDLEHLLFCNIHITAMGKK